MHDAVTRLDQVVFDPQTAAQIRRYYTDDAQQDRTYTARHFGRLLPDGSSEPERFTTDDLASLALVGEPIGTTATLHLLNRGHHATTPWAELLGEVPADVHFTKVQGRELLRGETADGQPRRAAHDLWDAVLGIEGVSRTQASLLLNLKRPKLLPIWTPVVESVIGSRVPWWSAVASFLEDDDRKVRFESLREEALEGTGVPAGEVTLLRLIDVVLWMRFRAASAPIER